MTKEKER